MVKINNIYKQLFKLIRYVVLHPVFIMQHWWSYAIDNIVVFNTISMTELKSDTISLTLLFCRKKYFNFLYYYV